MSDTIYCHVEQDPDGFHPDGIAGFSVRLSVAPDAASDDAAHESVERFLGALKTTEFVVYVATQFDGTVVATMLKADVDPIRADLPDDEAAQLRTAFVRWLARYGEGKLGWRHTAPAVGEEVTRTAGTLSIQDVITATASQPAPFPHRLGLAMTLRIKEEDLPPDAKLLIVPLSLVGFIAPKTVPLSEVPEPGSEIELPSAAGDVRCRTTIVKPLVNDPTSLIDLSTGFFKPSDESAQSHRFLERLEQRGGSQFTGFVLAASIEWPVPDPTTDQDLERHVGRLSWKAVAALAGALDPVLLALFMPGREARDGALLGEMVDKLAALSKGGASRNDCRNALRVALRHHPLFVLDPKKDRLAHLNALRDACGLPPLTQLDGQEIPATLDWLDLLLLASSTTNEWAAIGRHALDRFKDSDGLSRELDRLLGTLQDTLTSEAGIEATTLRLLRHASVVTHAVTILRAAIPDPSIDVDGLYADAIDAFARRLGEGLDGAQLARQAVGSLVSDLLLADVRVEQGDKSTTLNNLVEKLKEWKFWAHRFGQDKEPPLQDSTVVTLMSALVRPNLRATDFFERTQDVVAATKVIDDAADTHQASVIANLSPPPDRRFQPDPEPRPLAIQLLVDAAADDAADDAATDANDFAAVFSGVAVLLQARRSNTDQSAWAHANLAEATLGGDTATTIKPLPTTVQDGRRQLFVEYRGVPFASRAYEKTLPTAGEGMPEALLTFDYDPKLNENHVPVPSLAYGTRYDVAVHAVGRSGALPVDLQAAGGEPWVPVMQPSGNSDPLRPFNVTSLMYSRTMAIGATAIRERDDARGTARRIGVGLDGVRPLAADYPRLSLAGSTTKRTLFLDVFRNADGSGAIALPSEAGKPVQVALTDVHYWGGCAPELIVEVLAGSAATRSDALASLRIVLPSDRFDCRLTIERDAGGQFKVTESSGASGAWSTVLPSVWLRLRVAKAADGGGISLADPATDQGGPASGSRPMPSRLLLCAPEGTSWRAPFNKEASLWIESPRTSWANVQRWLDNPKLADDWLSPLTDKQCDELRTKLLTADLLRAEVKELAELLDRLPDPAVRFLEVDLHALDSLRDDLTQLHKDAKLVTPCERIEVKSIGKLLDSLPGWGKLDLIELLRRINDACKTPLTVRADSTTVDAKLWLKRDGAALAAKVPAGMVAQLHVRPLVARRHFESREVADPLNEAYPPVIDERLLQWATGHTGIDGTLYARFPGAELQVEAMLGPIVRDDTTRSAPSSATPWLNARADWTRLAEHAVQHDPIGTSRKYRLQAGAPHGADAWTWRQAGWIDVETQRWRFTGRPIQHWFRPQSLRKVPADQPSFEIDLDDNDRHVIASFMAEAFDNRSDSDNVVQGAPLLPQPAKTTLVEMAWEKPSATLFRHRLTIRSRYEGAMVNAREARCAAWSDADPAGPWRVVAMLGERGRITLGRPQLRALMPLTTTPLDSAAGPATPPVLAILHDRPFDLGGLAERMAGEIRQGVGYDLSGPKVLPADARKEAGPDPRLSYRPLDEALARSLVLSAQGPIGLTFDATQGTGQAFPNMALMLHPLQVLPTSEGAAEFKPVRMEESFLSVSLRRHLDPAWLVPDLTLLGVRKNIPFDSACWFSGTVKRDWTNETLIEVENGDKTETQVLARGRHLPRGDHVWLDILIPKYFVDETAAPPKARGKSVDAWLCIASMPIAPEGASVALMHVPGSGRLANLSVLLQTSNGDGNADLGQGNWQLLGSIDWSGPLAWGDMTFRTERKTKTRTRTETLDYHPINASAPTALRWARTGRDFDTVFAGDAEQDVPVSELAGELAGELDAQALSLHRRAGGTPLWVRSRQSAQRFPTSTQRHVAALYSRHIRGLGEPKELLRDAWMLAARNMPEPPLVERPEFARLLEFEVPSRPCVYMPENALCPDEYRQAYHDLVSVGFNVDEPNQKRLSMHVRLIGAESTLADIDALTFGVRGTGQGVPWVVKLPRPTGADKPVHAVELDLDLSTGHDTEPDLTVRAGRWIIQGGGMATVKSVGKAPDSLNKATPHGIFVTLTGVQLKTGGVASELWAESSVLVSRLDSGAGFGGRLDFDWFFGAHGAFDPADAVSVASLRQMPEAQARLIAISPPVKLVKKGTSPSN